MSPPNCVQCGGRLTRPSKGRPSKFCSVGCRRASEFAVRRLNRRLERLEDELEDLRGARDDGVLDWRNRTFTQQRAALSEGIRETEDRLRRLLDSQEDA